MAGAGSDGQLRGQWLHVCVRAWDRRAGTATGEHDDKHDCGCQPRCRPRGPHEYHGFVLLQKMYNIVPRRFVGVMQKCENHSPLRVAVPADGHGDGGELSVVTCTVAWIALGTLGELVGSDDTALPEWVRDEGRFAPASGIETSAPPSTANETFRLSVLLGDLVKEGANNEPKIDAETAAHVQQGQQRHFAASPAGYTVLSRGARSATLSPDELLPFPSAPPPRPPRAAPELSKPLEGSGVSLEVKAAWGAGLHAESPRPPRLSAYESPRRKSPSLCQNAREPTARTLNIQTCIAGFL
jgi:hypothetical protein